MDRKFKRTILLRYSELTLKKGNRNNFTKILITNIKKRLKQHNIEYFIERNYDFSYIHYSDNEKKDDIIKILKSIPGISWFTNIHFFDDKNSLKKYLLSNLDLSNPHSFKVFSKNGKDNDYFSNSHEIIEWVAGIILVNSKWRVDLNNYEKLINVSVLNNKLVLYFDIVKGIIGLPAGSNGKGIALLSGGIDSPVASLMTIARGTNLSFVTFLTQSTGKENTLKKIEMLAEKINESNGFNQSLFIVNFTKVQNLIRDLKEDEYRITILRRMFIKFADFISEKYNFEFTVTGDSLGQVASQTIDSLSVIDSVSTKLILRPLISLSKEEIITKARTLGTLEISLMEGEDMCSDFTPKNPKINPKINKITQIESKLVKINIDEVFKDILEKNTIKIPLGNINNEKK